jgi:hypothetical protein
MSTEINPAGDPEDQLSDQDANEIYRGILDLVLALNTGLSKSAGAARRPGDRMACELGTLLAHELGKCYEGRLISFRNPLSAP